MDEANEKKCCCGCMSLDKGVMLIGIVTLFELCATFSNFRTTWFIFILKLLVIFLFVGAFCNIESARVRQALWVTYLIFAVVEGLALIGWCLSQVYTDAAANSCAEVLATEEA